MRELLEKMISDHSGRDIEQVSRDIERDKILTAEGAVEYGLIDAVLESLKHARPDLIARNDSCPSPARGAARGTVEGFATPARPAEMKHPATSPATRRMTARGTYR